MIRVEMTEEDAVSLHDVVQRLRRIAPHVSDPLRGVELSLSGALRAAGYVPDDIGWVPARTGSRR